jgi:hypothetical protein
MKTVKKGSEYKRVSDSEAHTLVTINKYSYCSKQEWKQNVRDINKSLPVQLGEATTAQPVPNSDKKLKTVIKNTKKKK